MCAYRRPPELSPGQVSRLVKWLFPFREVVESSVKQLPGFEDRNYYLEATAEGTAQSSTEFVLKVYNATTLQELAEGICSVLTYLNSQGFSCSVPLTSRDGNVVLMLCETHLLHPNTARQVRSGRQPRFCTVLHTYIPGIVLSEVANPSPQLLYDVARHVGTIDAALQDFTHPVLDTREFSEPCWDLRQLHHLRKYLPFIKDSRNRKATEKVLINFNKNVAPRIPSMKTGLIWGDAHTHNVILQQSTTVGMKQSPVHQIAGVIDFGDCSNTCYVFELAIMLAKLMQGQEDPIRFACPLISGYISAFPLDKEELDCLYHAVLARLCLVSAMVEYQYNREPWNSYLGEMIEPGWKLVQLLQNTPKEVVDKIWFEAWAQGR